MTPPDSHQHQCFGCSAGTFGDEVARQRGLALLLANRDTGADIPPDVRGVVYRLAVQSGDPRAYEIVKTMYLQVRVRFRVPSDEKGKGWVGSGRGLGLG